MTKPIGPTFPAELEAAGLAGLPFSWSLEGEFWWSEDITEEQQAAVLVVYDAHDPTKSLPPVVTSEVQAIYSHENRLRTLEGLPPLSLTDVLTKYAAGQL